MTDLAGYIAFVVIPWVLVGAMMMAATHWLAQGEHDDDDDDQEGR